MKNTLWENVPEAYIGTTETNFVNILKKLNVAPDSQGETQKIPVRITYFLFQTLSILMMGFQMM